MKSAPELWGQVSDPDALADRLDGFGPIRITRTEHERHVAWEGETASGDVVLEPAGWGTRVTLTARRRGAPEAEVSAAPVEPEPAAARVEPDAAPVEPERLAAALTSETLARIDPELTVESPALRAEDFAAVPAAEPERTAAPGPKRQGFWARLLGRHKRREDAVVNAVDVAAPPNADGPAAAIVDVAAPEPAVAEPPRVSLPEATSPPPPPAPPSSTPTPPPPPTPPAPPRDDCADHQRLSAVLDELGANHHRPFSRG